MNICAFWNCRKVATRKVFAEGYEPGIFGEYCEDCAKNLKQKSRNYRIEKL